MERLLVKKLPCSRLHPNAQDEFTFPDIGPHYGIIAQYEEQIRENKRHGNPVFEEPIMVEKLHPHGYLILNGHHRWAAAVRQKVGLIPVEIINLAQESDIQKILENSKHDKRATFDMDEVVFRPEGTPFLEKELGFPYSIKHKKRIRLGIPVLFYNLSKNGYDIWLYSANYESIDDVRDYFRCYGVHVDGIITGMAKDKKSTTSKRAGVEKLIANKYAVTLHVDNDMILRTEKKSGEFQERSLDPGENWSKEAIAFTEELAKSEKNGAN